MHSNSGICCRLWTSERFARSLNYKVSLGNGSDSIFGPLNATVEKQNCGVKLGVGEGSVIMSAGGAFFGASALEGLNQKNSASMN